MSCNAFIIVNMGINFTCRGYINFVQRRFEVKIINWFLRWRLLTRRYQHERTCYVYIFLHIGIRFVTRCLHHVTRTLRWRPVHASRYPAQCDNDPCMCHVTRTMWWRPVLASRYPSQCDNDPCMGHVTLQNVIATRACVTLPFTMWWRPVHASHYPSQCDGDPSMHHITLHNVMATRPCITLLFTMWWWPVHASRYSSQYDGLTLGLPPCYLLSISHKLDSSSI